MTEDVRSQSVPGYPNAAQIEFYVKTPTVAFGLVLVGLAWRLWAPAPVAKVRWIGTLLLAISLLGLLPYLFFYTGGM